MIPLLGGIALAGALIALTSAWALRASGARANLGRRLAGARGTSVASLVEASDPPDAPIRLAGRIRCGDPIRAEGDERLVALHGDVELRTGGRWRGIERQRETRSFELWDRGGSLSLDPALAAEPLVVIPKVWRGTVDQLPEPLTAAGRRLIERAGGADEVRWVTRTINVTDELLVLAHARREPGGGMHLEPPEGGYIITNLQLDDAMRLLGGRHRRVAAFAIVGIGLGSVVTLLAGVTALLFTVFG